MLYLLYLDLIEDCIYKDYVTSSKILDWSGGLLSEQVLLSKYMLSLWKSREKSKGLHPIASQKKHDFSRIFMKSRFIS